MVSRNMDGGAHRHVSVFHGVDARFSPGLVLLLMADATWQVCDETGQIGPAGAVYGTWPSERAACQHALRLLRSRFGATTVPCWGAGAPNGALAELGYPRGRVRWRWWPPGFTRVGEKFVGPDGAPALPDPRAA